MQTKLTSAPQAQTLISNADFTVSALMKHETRVRVWNETEYRASVARPEGFKRVGWRFPTHRLCQRRTPQDGQSTGGHSVQPVGQLELSKT